MTGVYGFTFSARLRCPDPWVHYIAKVREHIEKLQEYRATIISAAVTGKIDVREEIA